MQSNYRPMTQRLVVDENQPGESADIIYGKKEARQLLFEIAYRVELDKQRKFKLIAKVGIDTPKKKKINTDAAQAAIIKELGLASSYDTMKNITDENHIKLINMALALKINVEYNDPEAIPDEELKLSIKQKVKIYRIFGNACRYVYAEKLHPGQPLGVKRRECPMNMDEAKRIYEESKRQ